MRIRDWSSDVCSSDLKSPERRGLRRGISRNGRRGDRSQFHPQCFGNGEDVLVAPSGEIDHDDLVLVQCWHDPFRGGKRVSGFQCRDDAFESAEALESRQRLIIGHWFIANAPDFMKPRMLRANPRIIEPCGYAVCFRDLSIIILQKIGLVPVQNTRGTAGKARGMPGSIKPFARRLDTDDFDTFIIARKTTLLTSH